MRLPSWLSPPPILDPARIRLAYGVAVATDLVQLALGPFGWAFADELLDIVAMTLTWRLIGFHPLLLPTFVLEFVPVAGMLPTWTGCVALVVATRRRQPIQQRDERPIIDVEAKRVE